MRQHPLDFILIEGAGGWFVPLNDNETMADLCIALEIPIILVVGLKLGCLNHALLTQQAISDAGLNLAGWVGNQIDPKMEFIEENLDTLKQSMNAPCLGNLLYSPIDPVKNAKETLTLPNLNHA